MLVAMSAPLHEPLALGASAETKREVYARVSASIDALLAEEDDWVSAMAPVLCGLHTHFGYFHWTGFYRTGAAGMLAVGPYQGGHGCLRIPFDKGVCGAAARTRETQLVPDVEAFPGHIACSSSTRSEVVVPLVANDRVLAVLDVDSDDPAAFDEVDRAALETLCGRLAARYG